MTQNYMESEIPSPYEPVRLPRVSPWAPLSSLAKRSVEGPYSLCSSQSTSEPVPGTVSKTSRGTTVIHSVTEGGTEITYMSRADKDDQPARVSHKIDRPDWDEWLISIAFLVSLRSPDKSTKHGAVLSNEYHQILGIGYNGFIRGSNDSEIPQERPIKYLRVLHAETNCILNSQNLMFGNNYTMHITGMPCSNCFLQIAQSRIKRVVYGSVTSHCVDGDQINIVNDLAKDHNIELVQFDTPSSLVEMLEKYRYGENDCEQKKPQACN